MSNSGPLRASTSPLAGSLPAAAPTLPTAAAPQVPAAPALPGSPAIAADGNRTTAPGPVSQLTLPATSAARPAPDTGKTWGGPDSKVELNFGHRPDAQGRLYKLDPSGVPVWAANGKAITADQWANMPKFQQEAIAAQVPEAQRAGFLAEMATGVASRAFRTKPAPLAGVDPNLPLSGDAKGEMANLAQLAIQKSQGKRPDGMCYSHVADYLEKFGVKYGAFGANAPALSGAYAKNFAELVDADPARYGLKKLALDNPYQAPPGAIVVVKPNTPGTSHPVAGDIAIATGQGWFANGGEMGYGGPQNFPPGNGHVLGIYVPA
ncbi:MAG: hypothetical protein VKP62_15410 [Candidatus Sericytochromatia bacterium]|nr:hypothetical protein [Candidatus Sericytochromatia bacterium]